MYNISLLVVAFLAKTKSPFLLAYGPEETGLSYTITKWFVLGCVDAMNRVEPISFNVCYVVLEFERVFYVKSIFLRPTAFYFIATFTRCNRCGIVGYKNVDRVFFYDGAGH